jgi:Protein of unknown function (DUF3638)
LLFEVENEILIWLIQQSVAKLAKVTGVESRGNAVMQFNMGEGKSFVIVPIIASALAKGQRLVHIIIMKPQFRQMMHSLTTKLRGLLDCQVYIFPISRQLRHNEPQA